MSNSPESKVTLVHLSLEVGRTTECRFCEMLEKAKEQSALPPWIKGWKKVAPNSITDRKGMDVLIYTDRGMIGVSLKSSYQRKILTERQHPDSDIVNIAFNFLLEEEELLGMTISSIGERYRKMPERR